MILSIASIIGTVLTQDDPYPNYVNQFGPFWADIFRSLSLYTVYSSWWFMLILGFLMVSVSLCVIRNAPKMIADAKSWKDKVREGSLRAFHHKGEFAVHGTRAQTAAVLARLSAKLGYKFVTRESEGATLIAAKRGALTKFGYISAHLAIVVICLGGLLDSNLPIKLQMWLFDKSPIRANTVINDIPPEHRLSQSNPTFRGYAWVPEGQHVSTAILNQPDGSLIQDLPFSIELNKFIVDYYSTGMPKLFASDIVVVDHETGARVPARIEVNKPFTYDGVSIYQSSFQDGGSQMQMTAYPMTGASAKTSPFGGTIGGNAPFEHGHAARPTVKPSSSPISARSTSKTSRTAAARPTRAASRQSHAERSVRRAPRLRREDARSRLDLHNVGPSVQYKVRDKDGQAREYNNYMLPVDVAGEKMFLAGMRAEPGRSVPLPAHSRRHRRHRQGMDEPARHARKSGHARVPAAHRFALRSVPGSNTELQQHLEESALRVLTLFAGADKASRCRTARRSAASRRSPRSSTIRCRRASRKRPPACCCACWKARRGICGNCPASNSASRRRTANADASRFIQSSINAISDSFLYGSPVYLQLDSFKQVQASVFQLTRAPGKKVVYLGSLLLVLGIFSMFYVRERRLWFWLKDTEHGTNVVMAMSSARKTLDFEKEFVQTRDAVGAALGAKLTEASDAAGATNPTGHAGAPSASSQDSTR